MEFLSVESIIKKKGNKLSVDNISFSLEKGQRLGIAGETGSGKSTLLKIISGLEQTDTGTVTFKGNKVLGPNEKLIPGHPGIAYLSQHFELRNNYRVEEILEYATLLEEKKAQTIFDICRISHLLKRKTDQVSGGEKQRIALARLLAGSPSLLILDEPFSNLDILHKNIIRKVIDDLGTELSITCILVSHDPQDLLSWSDRIIILKEGKLIQDADPRFIYNYPADEYSAGLMGPVIKLSGNLANYISESSMVNSNHILVRPEHIQVDEQSQARGEIISCRFFGNFNELEVSVQGEVLPIRTTDMTLKEGMIIPLKLDPQQVNLLG